MFVKRIPKWYRKHLHEHDEDFSPPEGACPSIFLWWKLHAGARSEIEEAIADNQTDFKSAEELESRLEEFQGYGEYIWRNRAAIGTIFEGQANDKQKRLGEREERYSERPRIVQVARPGGDMTRSKAAKGYDSVARDAESQYDRLGRSGRHPCRRLGS